MSDNKEEEKEILFDNQDLDNIETLFIVLIWIRLTSGFNFII